MKARTLALLAVFPVLLLTAAPPTEPAAGQASQPPASAVLIHKDFAAALPEAPPWAPRHAAGDLDGDGAEELAVDFGASGAWLWNAGAWTQISANNPE